MPNPCSPIALFGTVDGHLVELDDLPQGWTWKTVEPNLRAYAERHELPLVFVGDSGTAAHIAVHVLHEGGYDFEFAGYSLHATKDEWPREEQHKEPDCREVLTRRFADELLELDSESAEAKFAMTIAQTLPFDDDEDRVRVEQKLVQLVSAVRQQVLALDDAFERTMAINAVAQKLTEMLLGEPNDEGPKEPNETDAEEEFRDLFEHGTYAEVQTLALTSNDPIFEILPDADYDDDDGILEFDARFGHVEDMRAGLEVLAGRVRQTAHFVAELSDPWVQYLVTATPGRVLARRIYLSFERPEAQQAWKHFAAAVPEEVLVEAVPEVESKGQRERKRRAASSQRARRNAIWDALSERSHSVDELTDFLGELDEFTIGCGEVREEIYCQLCRFEDPRAHDTLYRGLEVESEAVADAIVARSWHRIDWVRRSLVPELQTRLERAAELDPFGRRMLRVVAECAETHDEIVGQLAPNLRKAVLSCQRS